MKIIPFTMLLILVLPAIAYTQYGMVTGTVYYINSIPIPGVKVTAKPVENMYPVMVTTTNESGRFVFIRLRAGEYKFHFMKEGFCECAHTEVLVNADQRLDVIGWLA